MKYFPPFRFESSSGLLWREDQQVAITRKAAHLLECLMDRAGVIVEHDQIMQCVWHDTHVQPDNIKVLVHELRTALADRTRTQYIKTAAGRGYMFVGALTDAPVYSPVRSEGAFVGREAELDDILAVLNRSVSTSDAQIYLVEGDRGMGKTMLCDALVYRARTQTSLRVVRGQAFESSAAIESDGALMDAIDLFTARHPETGLSPAPPASPFATDGVERGPALVRGESSRLTPRLVRHLVGMLERLARDLPLLVILEDVHLGDWTTLECLRTLARRPLGARLCIVVTYAREPQTPLVHDLDRLGRDLKMQHRGGSLKLAPLSAADVAECVVQRLGAQASADLSATIYEATGGHPLLLASALDTLESDLDVSEPWTDRTTDRARARLDSSMTDGIQNQIDRLTSDDRILLETAAATGLEFTASAVAAGLGCEHDGPIARRLAALAARRMIIDAVVSPEPVPPTADPAERRYRFRQAVAADLLTAPMPIARVTEIAARLRRSAGRRRRMDGPGFPIRAAK